MSDSSITFAVLTAIVVLMASNRASPGLVAIGAALVLAATGVIDYASVSAGLGDPVILMIASLFVVSEALDVTGITTWVGRRVVSLGGGGARRTLVLVMLLSALLTSLISVNGAVAALVPMTVLVAMRVSEPSRMLMPLAFAAHAGSMLTLTGTPVNVIVNEQLAAAGVDELGYLEFALVGLPLVAGVVLITWLIGDRVLPRPAPRSALPDLSRHGATLAEQYVTDLPPDELVTREHGVAEVAVHPRSPLVGQRAYPGMTTDSGRFVVLAIQRAGKHVHEDAPTALAAGDMLLLQGSWRELEAGIDDGTEVLVVDEPTDLRRQAVPMGPGSRRALAVLAGMVVLLVTGAVPAAIATLVAAIAMVLSRTLTVDQAYGAISWRTIVLVAAMIPVSGAVTASGAAEQLGDALVDAVSGLGPRALLLGLFLLVAVLGQLISNMATALIVIPIGLSAAADLGVHATPVLVCITVAAAASFLTPVATPANLMVQPAAGYRFGDYWRLGLPLLVWFGVVAVGLVPLVWPL